MRIAIITPVFNNWDGLSELVPRVDVLELPDILLGGTLRTISSPLDRGRALLEANYRSVPREIINIIRSGNKTTQYLPVRLRRVPLLCRDFRSRPPGATPPQLAPLNDIKS
jgi:hypothetical protein